ncbi:hypothetical protein Tco_1510325, partial [Tanacetum coccineum]
VVMAVIPDIGPNDVYLVYLPLAHISEFAAEVISCITAVMTVIPDIGPNDVYLVYLPLAHISEFAAEVVLLTTGSSMGYGSAPTFTDTSNKIKK